jgi:molybdate transport system substrate-binding protein
MALLLCVFDCESIENAQFNYPEVKMKKLSWILAVALLVSLCLTACGQTAGGTAPTPSSVSASSAPAASPSVSAASPSAAASTPAAAHSPSASTGQQTDLNGHTLMIYCGAGMSKPFQEIADTFQTQTGCEMEVTYANAGQIQTQINTSKEGDLFIAGSGDELQPIKAAVSTSVDLVKHIPVLAVKAGNPLGIKTLADLAKPDIRVVLGDADSTPIGKIANKALTDAGVLDKVNIVARTTTAPEIFNALTMDQCDAIIVWKENATGDKVQVVDDSEMQKYIKSVPAASLTYSKDADALAAFLKYLSTDDANSVWTKYGYELVK